MLSHLCWPVLVLANFGVLVPFIVFPTSMLAGIGYALGIIFQIRRDALFPGHEWNPLWVIFYPEALTERGKRFRKRAMLSFLATVLAIVTTLVVPPIAENLRSTCG